MGVTEIREELHHFIDEGDTKLLKMLYAIAKEYASDEYELSEAQQEELDVRIEKYEAGRMNFSTWEQVKQRVRNNPRNAR